MMSKNSIVPFLKDYLIKFLTRPFLLDTNDFIIFCLYVFIYKYVNISTVVTVFNYNLTII